MEDNIISLETAQRVVSALKTTFDSHDFIMAFVLSDTTAYLGLLRRYHNVITANQMIGRFLLNKSNDLSIDKQDEIESENILGKLSKCALWVKK